MITEGFRIDELTKQIAKLKAIYDHVFSKNPGDPRLFKLADKVYKLQREKSNWEALYKATEKIDNNSMLTEINISNKQTLNQEIVKILKNKNVLNNLNILKWFAGPFTKWFISPKDDETKRNSVEKHVYKTGEPEYLKHSDVFDFKGFSSDQTEKLNHIIDYFLSLPDNDQKKLPTTSFSQISRRVQEWDRRMAQQMKSAEFGRYQLKAVVEGKDIKTIYKFNDGYRFVQLLSQESRQEEGRIMGHCIGGYTEDNHFSLRDPSGFPHVTIEFNGKDIKQIKGKQNKSPVPKYIPYVKKFILDNKFNVIRDGKNIGMVEWKETYYWENSQIFQDIYKNEIIPEREKRFNEIKSRIKNGVIEKHVNISNLFLKQLPDFLNGLVIGGDFSCNNNQLTSLQGAPQTVNGYFNCSNNKLTSLQGAPREVGGGFYCHYNQLTSLQGSPEKIGGDFYCYNNKLTSLQGAPREVGRNFYCSNNQLTSLQGAPQTVNGYFNCSNNKLTSLQGAPREVGGGFYCENNPLKSLDGKPEFIKGKFYGPKNLLENMKEEMDSINNIKPPSLQVSSNSFRIEFINFIKNAENAAKEGFNEKSNRWYPHKSPEGGLPTIGYGHKIKNKQELSQLSKGVSDDQINKFLISDLQLAKKNVYDYIKRVYKVSLLLDQQQEEMLIDFAFNLGGLDKFPKFTDAVLRKDWEKAKLEFKRYYNGKELTRRNNLFFNRYFKDNQPTMLSMKENLLSIDIEELVLECLKEKYNKN